MLRKLKPKDKINFEVFVNNKLKFSECLRGQKLAFVSEENDIINGVLYVEKTDKDYLYVMSKSKKVTNNLLKIFFWNWKKEIYALIEEHNKLGFILKKNHFRIVGKTGNTFLLHYNPIEKRLKYGKHNQIN
jgi:hypothetical protein